MIPLRLEMENFTSHSNSILDFDKFDAALIIGEDSGNPRISNAVGKTSIFDAIRWVLFGKTRLSTKDKVIKRGKDHCIVSFIFKIDDNIYRIIRRQSKKAGMSDVIFAKNIDGEWEVDGFTADTNTATNRRIQEVIGLSHDTFINSIYFRQNDITGFAGAKPTARKEILKEILQIGTWDLCNKDAKENYKRISSKVDFIKERIEDFSSLDDDKNKIENDLKNTDNKIKETKLSISKIENNILEIEEDISGIELTLSKLGLKNPSKIKEKLDDIFQRGKDIKSKKKDITLEIKKNTEKIEILNKECISFEEKMAELAEIVLSVKDLRNLELEKLYKKLSKNPFPPVMYDLSSLEKRKIKLSEEVKRFNILELQIKQLDMLEPGTECPTCLTELKGMEKNVKYRREVKERFLKEQLDKSKSLIEEYNSIIGKDENYINEAKNLSVEIERIILIHSQKLNEIKNIEEKNNNLSVEKNDLTNRWKKLKEYNQKFSLMLEDINNADKSQKQINSLFKKKKALYTDIENFKNQLIEFSIIKGTFSEKLENINRKFSEKATLISQRDVLLNELNTWEKLTKAFSKDGIQAIIMENVTEDIRKYTNEVLQTICNENMSIDFITQKKTTSGNWKEDFDIKITTENSIVDFDDLSGGEQVRVAIAVRLSLSKILMRRVGSNVKFLLLDEVDQSLDRHGVDVLADVIKKLSGEFKILLITHNEMMKERFNHIITVHKKPSGSVLIQ